MKRFIASSIAALSLLASGTPAFAARIDQLDKPINLTARVLDGSIVQDVERIYPELGPNGTKYNPESIKQYREENLAAHQEHCKTHMSWLKKLISGCGRGFVRSR